MKNLNKEKASLVSIIVLFLLSGCGGGSSSSSDSSNDNVAPTISSFIPASNSNNVSVDSVVNVVFDEDMFTLSITDTSFTLQSIAGEQIGAQINYNETIQTASLTPNDDMALLTSYEVTLTSNITDLAGNALNNTVWQFMTQDGNWQAEQPIEIDGGNAKEVQVVTDNNGNSMAVWTQFDGSFFSIMANKFDVTTGWGTATVIETDDNGSAFKPQIAVDKNGNMMAVWEQYSGSLRNAWANYYSVNSGWGNAVLIETLNTGSATSPQIAFDNDGNATAVWSQFNGVDTNIYTSRFNLDQNGVGAWGGTQTLQSASLSIARDAKIVIDANNNALVVWEQSDPSDFNIWSNRYTPLGGWSTAELIETENLGDAMNVQIAINATGDAMAIWTQVNATNFKVWANRFDTSTGWGVAQKIEALSTTNGFNPQIAIDKEGNALAVWHSDGILDAISANYFGVNTGWGSETNVASVPAGINVYSQVAFDSNGNALAIWDTSDFSDFTFNIRANRFNKTSGWNESNIVDISKSSFNAEKPQLSIGKQGKAISVWVQSDSFITNIYASHFE